MLPQHLLDTLENQKAIVNGGFGDRYRCYYSFTAKIASDRLD